MVSHIVAPQLADGSRMANGKGACALGAAKLAPLAAAAGSSAAHQAAVEAAFAQRDVALAGLAEGFSIADPNLPDCPIVFVNDAFCLMTGYSRQEVVGRNCRFMQGPKTDAEAVAKLRAAIAARTRVSVELLNYKKNGEEFWNLLTVSPVHGADGCLMAFVGVQSDVTELVRRRAKEATLQEARKTAELATEAKSMFLANMSHEIRTPLNGMIAIAQLLLSTPLSPEQRELTETILDSGNTLLSILGDILDFSKIDHDSMTLEQQPLWLRDTLEATIEMVAAQATRKGIELGYSMDPRLTQQRVVGDIIRIRQVIANLLTNAVKFTERGEIEVTCVVEPTPSTAANGALANGNGAAAAAADAEAEAEALPRIHVSVRDTGIGISEEGMAKLFQSFRQGHESMTRKYGGTGLGLVISRKLAELMGGSVWVESTLGGGSTFHFTAHLPWASPDAPPTSPSAASRPDHGFSMLGNNTHSNRSSFERRPSMEAAGRTSMERGTGRSSLERNTPPMGASAAGSTGSAASTSSWRRGNGDAEEWSSIRGHELDTLRGLRVRVDVPHPLISNQVVESCQSLGMVADAGGAIGTSHCYDFCVCCVENVAVAMRGGWKGKPVVAVGKRELVPAGMQPLVVTTARPVKHVRLATALVKASVLMRGSHAALASLHVTGLAGGGAAGLLQGGAGGAFDAEGGKRAGGEQRWRATSAAADYASRRISLDNSALERPTFGAPMRQPLSREAPGGEGEAGELPAAVHPRMARAHSRGNVAPIREDHSFDESGAGNDAALRPFPPPSAPVTPGFDTFTTSIGGLQPPEQLRRASAEQAPPLRILIAEDNRVNQIVILKVLKRVLEGCQPDVVGNGSEVLTALERKVYDVILMDIHMPVMDGLEASRRICELYSPLDRPHIVALSADTLKVLHDKCRAVGIEEFICKPFRVEDVQRVVRNVRPVRRAAPVLLAS